MPFWCYWCGTQCDGQSFTVAKYLLHHSLDQRPKVYWCDFKYSCAVKYWTWYDNQREDREQRAKKASHDTSPQEFYCMSPEGAWVFITCAYLFLFILFGLGELSCSPVSLVVISTILQKQQSNPYRA